MKALRTYLTCCLLLIGAAGLSGCATTGHTDASVKAAQDRAWDDMTPAEKIGHYLYWPVQWGLLYGGSALAGGMSQ